jgi:hypothetical protein
VSEKYALVDAVCAALAGEEACAPRLTEQGAAGPIPDLVNRDFTADKPGQKMVGDISAPRGALPYRPRSGRR